GNVGRKIIEALDKRNFPLDNLYLVASKNSAGKEIEFKNKKLIVEDLEKFDFSKATISFFCCGSTITKEWAEKVAKQSIVPEVNWQDLKNFKKKNIIANPNCSTAQLVVPLKPLHDLYTIKRIVVSTYQSVSGAGKEPMDELISQTKQFLNNETIQSKKFTKQIAFNAIPHIDVFADDGYTKEELKMVNETKKILDKNIKLTATCVRIPVLVSHSESVNLQFEKSFNLEEVRSVLSKAEGCKVIDERKDGGYITPFEAEGKFETFISRMRVDHTENNCLNLWIVSDNLLKGAALNAVQIAETLINKKLI
ncbi:MAG: aspartate-semialdehyde dehydrogenase, partial [Pelagibacteraceae bacterium]